MVPVTDLEMAVNNTFSSIVNEIQLSYLNFCIQMTPFAAYITLKKSAQKDLSGNQVLPSPPLLFHLQDAQQNVLRLQEENSQLKAANEALKKDYNDLGLENECLLNSKKEANNTITILENKLDKAASEIGKYRTDKIDLETFSKDVKAKHMKEIGYFQTKIQALEKNVKIKEKENVNLKRNFENARDTILNMKSEKARLKTSNTKLEKEIRKLEKRVDEKTCTKKIAASMRNRNTDKNMNTLSCMTSPIPPASSQSAGVPSSPPPPSMISHWIPLHPPMSPGILYSMRSHYVSLHLPSHVCPSDKSQDASDHEYSNIELEEKEEGFIGPRLPRMLTDEEVKVLFKKLLGDKYEKD